MASHISDHGDVCTFCHRETVYHGSVKIYPHGGGEYGYIDLTGNVSVIFV